MIDYELQKHIEVMKANNVGSTEYNESYTYLINKYKGFIKKRVLRHSKHHCDDIYQECIIKIPQVCRSFKKQTEGKNYQFISSLSFMIKRTIRLHTSKFNKPIACPPCWFQSDRIHKLQDHHFMKVHFNEHEDDLSSSFTDKQYDKALLSMECNDILDTLSEADRNIVVKYFFGNYNRNSHHKTNRLIKILDQLRKLNYGQQ